MKLLIDNQLPPALSRHLSSRVSKCAHAIEFGLQAASNEEIWQYAADHTYILVSKDEDFFQRVAYSVPGPRLIWVRLGNCRNKQLLSAFDRSWPDIEVWLRSDERLLEIGDEEL